MKLIANFTMSLFRITMLVLIACFSIEYFFKYEIINPVIHKATLTLQEYFSKKDMERFSNNEDQVIQEEVGSKTVKVPQFTDREEPKEREISPEPFTVSKEMQRCIGRSNRYSKIELHEVKSLYCIGGDVGDLSILKRMPNLERLELVDLTISDIDLGNNTKLKYLNLSNNRIAQIDLSKNLELEYLDLSSNAIERLNIADNEKIKYLLAFKNNLRELSLGRKPELLYVYLNDNRLSRVELPLLPKLEKLYLYNNQLNEVIGLDAAPSLEVLEVFGNELSLINLEFNSKLRFLTIQNNPLERVIVGNKKIDKVWSWNTNLSDNDIAYLKSKSDYYLETDESRLNIADLKDSSNPGSDIDRYSIRGRSLKPGDCGDQHLNELMHYLQNDGATLEGVSTFVERTADIDLSKCAKLMEVALWYHVDRYDFSIPSYLFKRGARYRGMLSSTSRYGVPFIQFAINSGDINLLQQLLEYGVEFKRPNERKTPFQSALASENTYFARLLYRAGGHKIYEPEKKQIEEGFEIPLSVFANPDLFSFFRSTGELAVYDNQNDRKLNYLLLTAVQKNDYRFIDELLVQGANVNFRWWQEVGEISLIESVIHSADPSMIKHLLELGAAIPKPRSYWLDWDEHPEKADKRIVSLFNQALKAQELKRSNIGLALSYAILDGDSDHINFLLNHSLTRSDKRVLHDALIFSIATGKNEFVNRILKEENLELWGDSYSYPLAYAIKNGNTEVMRKLLEKGVSVIAPEQLGHGDEGNSILEMAIDLDDPTAMELIIEFYPEMSVARLMRLIRKKYRQAALQWLDDNQDKSLLLKLPNWGGVLRQAVEKDDIALVKRILSSKDGNALIQAKNHGSGILMSTRSPEMSDLLMERGAKYFWFSQRMDISLSNAIYSGNREKFLLLVSALPESGYKKGFFDRHQKTLTEKGEEELLALLNQKIAQLESGASQENK